MQATLARMITDHPFAGQIAVKSTIKTVIRPRCARPFPSR